VRGRRLGRVLEVTARGAVALAGAATVGGFADVWPLAVAANLRAQLAAVLAAGAALLGLRGRWPWAAAAAGGAALNAGMLAPLWRRRRERGSTARLRLFAFNLLYANWRHDEVIGWLQQSDADVVVLVEAGGTWGKRLEEADLPFTVTRVDPEHPGDGAVVLTRAAPLDTEVLHLGPRPALAVTVPVGRGRVRVLGIHPYAPTTPRGALLQEEEFAAVAAWVGDQEDPVVVAGDCNATRWYPPFRALFAAGLADSGVGHGWQPTWAAGPLRMPIDHVLHGPELVTISRSVGPPRGSDHRPVEVVLALRPQPTT